MRRIFVIVLLSTVCSNTYATAPVGTIEYLAVGDQGKNVFISLHSNGSLAPNACSPASPNWNFAFDLKSTTTAGNGILSTLLTAYTTQTRVQIDGTNACGGLGAGIEGVNSVVLRHGP